MTQKNSTFDLEDFVPYLLNRAAEGTSLEFGRYYKSKYGMLRTEWRVLFHLGRYGELTAKSICERADIHKTKVSRAVGALEKKRILVRTSVENDRRHEALSLTDAGKAAFDDLLDKAQMYNDNFMAPYSKQERATIRKFLLETAKLVKNN